MLRMQNVSVIVKDGSTMKNVLSNINLVAEDSNITGIIGPSGSGKTTILSVAGLLQKADSGRIVVDEKDVSAMSDKEKALFKINNIGIVFQEPNLIPSLKVKDQLLLMKSLGKNIKNNDDDMVVVREILDNVGLLDYIDYYPSQLSGGQKQRVNIARALMNKPKILLVDEATSALDSEKSTEMINLFKKITAEYNTATLLVTHDERHFSVMDRKYHIMDGKIVEE